MRAQIASQKYEVASKSKALGMLSQVMGLSPQQTVEGLSEGTLPAEVTARLTPQVLMQIASVNKEIGDMAFKAADIETKQATANIDRQKFGLEKEKFAADRVSKARESLVGYAKLVDEIGQEAVDAMGIQRPVMPSSTQPAAPVSRTLAQAPSTQMPMQAPWASSMPRQDTGFPAMQSVDTTTPQPNVAPRPMSAPAAPPAPVAAPISNVMPPASQRKTAEAAASSNIQVSEQAAKERDKPALEKYNMISTYDTNTVNQNNTKYDELMALMQKYPKVAGQLVHQGPLYALLQAAESGVTTPMGSVSVPVSEAMSKLNLNPQEQSAARNMAQLISDLNQTVMKQGKAIYGPQISVFDAQKMAEPGFKNTDPASFISYLAAKNKVVNTYMGRLSEAQQNYFEANPRATTTSFFRSPEYKRIVEQFNATYKALIDKSPYK
jgi:hypothetical protein